MPNKIWLFIEMYRHSSKIYNVIKMILRNKKVEALYSLISKYTIEQW